MHMSKFFDSCNFEESICVLRMNGFYHGFLKKNEDFRSEFLVGRTVRLDLLWLPPKKSFCAFFKIMLVLDVDCRMNECNA